MRAKWEDFKEWVIRVTEQKGQERQELKVCLDSATRDPEDSFSGMIGIKPKLWEVNGISEVEVMNSDEASGV